MMCKQMYQYTSCLSIGNLLCTIVSLTKMKSPQINKMLHLVWSSWLKNNVFIKYFALIVMHI